MVREKRSPPKVTRPLLMRYVPRQRVYDLLEKSREFPVIWVSGPAGIGKTTLVNSFLKEHRLHSIWYQLDEGDDDPATFFYYLREAIQTIAPQKGKLLPLLAPEYQPGLQHFASRYFEQFFDLMPERSVVVLDNYQDLPASSELRSLMRQGFRSIPRGVNVIVLSRNVPPPEMARFQANRQMAHITREDLRLSPEETAGIVEMLSAGRISPDKASELHRLSEGWTAGVILLHQSAMTAHAEPMMLMRQGPEVVFDYFASEVLSRMDPVTREFLLKTAHLPRMSVDLARELTGNDDAGRILSRLARKNYFIEQRFQNAAIFSYHPLFRQFLLAQAKVELGGAALKEVSSVSARLLEREGYVDEVLMLIRDAGDWEALTHFLNRHGSSLLDQGRHRSLQRMLSQIPEDVLGGCPWLSFWLGMSGIPTEPTTCMGHLEAAYAQFKEAGDVTGIFRAWVGMARVITFGFSSWDKANELIRDLKEKEDLFNCLNDESLSAAVAGSMFGVIALRDSEHPEADAWYARAIDLNRKIGSLGGLMSVQISRVRHRLATGTLKQVASEIETLRALAGEGQLTEGLQIELCLIEILLYDLSLMHEECLASVDKGLELAESSGIHLWDPLMLCHGAMSCMNAGDQARTEAYASRLEKARCDPQSLLAVLVCGTRVRHAIINGDMPRAEEEAEQALHAFSSIVSPFLTCCSLILFAMLLRRLGKGDMAAAAHAHAATIAKEVKSPVVHLLLLLFEVETAIDQGDADHARLMLREMMPAVVKTGFRPVWDIPEQTAGLCAHALEAGLDEDSEQYIKAIIRVRHLVPDPLHANMDAWPWPVRIYTLGEFRITREDGPLQFSRKVQKKPLEMLKVLIALGGSRVPDERISDLLWPDTDGDRARQSCVTTLHRVRKMLEHHDAILRQSNLLTVNRSYVWVDAWAFENLLDQGEKELGRAVSKDGATKACGMIRAALERYTGNFMPGEDALPEIMSFQERLLDRFFEGLYKLNDVLMERGEWEEAAKLFEKGLGIDDSAESCYQGLMVCLRNLGRMAEAAQVFERCRRTLEARFGIMPSPDTVLLAKKMKQAGMK